jgi:hypothetical protein
MRATTRVYCHREGHGNGQVQGKSGGIMLLIISDLTDKTSTLNLHEYPGIVGKRLDWRVEADILAVGSEEC